MISILIFIIIILIIITAYIADVSYETIDEFTEKLENHERAFLVSNDNFIKRKASESFEEVHYKNTEKNKSILIVEDKVWLTNNITYFSVSFKSKKLSKTYLEKYFDIDFS